MIRDCRPEDVPAVVALIRELGEYEKLTHDLELSEEQLHRDVFEDHNCEVLVACEDERVVGYALHFPTYASFKTKAAHHLEDLFVTETSRGRGHGFALFAAVAAVAGMLVLRATLKPAPGDG